MRCQLTDDQLQPEGEILHRLPVAERQVVTLPPRLLRYVKGMVDQGIVFPKHGGGSGLWLIVFSKALPKTDDEGGLQLTAFSDADMAGDIDGRRSTSGVLVFLGSALISWQSLKQKVVALSTCEAKYVAAATAAC